MCVCVCVCEGGGGGGGDLEKKISASQLSLRNNILQLRKTDL